MLFIVGTPIGNLEDVSERCARTLREVDLIAAEDTRHSLRLLQRLEIHKPMISYHEHNEASRTPELMEKLRAGMNIALITDAGMPSISDPGRRLIAACIENELSYTVIPGPSAVLVALTGSGFQNDQWSFSGFLPNKSGQRERILTDACATGNTALFFESPHRLVKTLAVLATIAPTRRLCVARELTKQYEEFRIGVPSVLLAHYEAHPPKGEITLLIDGHNRDEIKAQKKADRDAKYDLSESGNRVYRPGGRAVKIFIGVAANSATDGGIFAGAAFPEGAGDAVKNGDPEDLQAEAAPE